MCRIWPSHLSSASPWSSLAILGAKANPVWGHVLTVLLAVYMCSHIIILAIACIACGILPAFWDIHTSLRAYSWFGPLFRPFAGVPQGRVRYWTEVRVHGQWAHEWYWSWLMISVCIYFHGSMFCYVYERIVYCTLLRERHVVFLSALSVMYVLWCIIFHYYCFRLMVLYCVTLDFLCWRCGALMMTSSALHRARGVTSGIRATGFAHLRPGVGHVVHSACSTSIHVIGRYKEIHWICGW